MNKFDFVLHSVGQTQPKSLVFSAFIYKPTSLLASNRASVFSSLYLYFHPTSKPSWFSWTFLMAYSKAKLKSSGDKTSPCFRPFWIWNASGRY